MPHGHAAQLLICHERLYAKVRDQFGPIQKPQPWDWCQLSASKWCEDCEYAVCSIHAAARHQFHRLHPERPNGEAPA